MNKILLLPFIVLFSIQLNAQNLDKLRIMCVDEVTASHYNGELSQDQLKNQIAALGFRYIENGQIKYHQDLIVYDCNTGHVKFTAVFDENKLVKEFILYEAKDVPAKTIFFTKSNTSDHVDLTFNYQGQEIPAYPIGKTKVFKDGHLVQSILFNENGEPPVVSNYDQNKLKTSEGPGSVSGDIQKEWEIIKSGEWKYFEGSNLTSISVYDQNGNKKAENLYSNGALIKENKFIANKASETTVFFTDGTIKETGTRQNDRKIGTWKYFNSKGQLKSTVTYRNGVEHLKSVYESQGNLVKHLELKTDQEELPKSMQALDMIYKTTTFYPDSTVQSLGYTHKNNQIGVFEYYNSNGELSEIKEYNLEGDEINSLEADTYVTMKEKERAIFRELLLAKTTHPLNLSIESKIQPLADSLQLDFDSLMMNYNYTKEYQQQYSKLSEQTAYFGNLSNKIVWYDSLLASTVDFANEVWSYSHDLHETELFLHKELANLKLNQKIDWLRENYTRSKKTLFGKKLIVVNKQDEIYNVIINEIHPIIKEEITYSNNKYQAVALSEEFVYLVNKAASIIAQPDKQFQESLKQTKSIQDKNNCFYR